jgi:hypothetical protein
MFLIAIEHLVYIISPKVPIQIFWQGREELKQEKNITFHGKCFLAAKICVEVKI